MADTILKVVKIFIGSPGGLDDERRAAKRIVDEINQSHSEHWGCQLNLVGWEETLPGFRRAQSLINQDLDKCDYFVGVVWDNWGSSPDDGDSRFSSGFEEEFERAKGHVEEGLMKDIALFFKDIREVQLKNLHPTYQRVVEFREKCVKQRRPFFKEFKKTSDFEILLRAKLSQIGWQESKSGQAQSTEAADSDQPENLDEQEPNLGETADNLIGASSARFVTELLQRPSDWEATDAYEVARLRLIAASTHRSGNSELYLGVHDANLLFEMRGEFDFSDGEYRGLIDTGVAGFGHQHVPLWHWLSCSSRIDDVFHRVSLLAIFGDSGERGNAIRILQISGQGVPQLDGAIDRAEVLQRWLTRERKGSEFDAAIEFLQTNGNAEDLKVLMELQTRISADRGDEVAAVIIWLATAKSASRGFEMLIDLDPDSLAENVADQLFAKPDSVPTETLDQCLILKSDVVRKKAAAILNSRKAIDEKTARRLMTDSDPEVRLAAVESLERLGQVPETATIKKALVLPKPRSLLGSLGSTTGQPDSTYYGVYVQNKLLRTSYKNLVKKTNRLDPLDYKKISTLYHRFTKKFIDEIRINVDDGYEGILSKNIDYLINRYGEESKVVINQKDVWEFLKRVLTSNALNALCQNSDKSDLKLVRKALDNHDLFFLRSALRFLSRFGDWSDKERILAMSQRFEHSQNILSATSVDRKKEIAAALYTIGKSRLIDLLKLDADVTIRRALLARMTQKDIRSLDDQFIVAELNNDDDQHRKLMALRCSQALSLGRIRKLLANYMNHDQQRYYNSVHWLDLGASMPRQVVKNVTKSELTKFQ